MKARVKRTGEIIDVDFCSNGVGHGWVPAETPWHCHKNDAYYRGCELEPLETEDWEISRPIDWEQRRYEIAKDISMTLISLAATVSEEIKDNKLVKNVGLPMVNLVKGSIEYADMLIRELKKKCNENSSFSDCEIAATNLFNSVRLFPYMWNGMLQGKSISEGRIMQGNKRLNEKRIHPTQKPVALYLWLLTKFAKEGVENT